jgi:hypothetical protein
VGRWGWTSAARRKRRARVTTSTVLPSLVRELVSFLCAAASTLYARRPSTPRSSSLFPYPHPGYRAGQRVSAAFVPPHVRPARPGRPRGRPRGHPRGRLGGPRPRALRERQPPPRRIAGRDGAGARRRLLRLLRRRGGRRRRSDGRARVLRGRGRRHQEPRDIKTEPKAPPTTRGTRADLVKKSTVPTIRPPPRDGISRE